MFRTRFSQSHPDNRRSLAHPPNYPAQVHWKKSIKQVRQCRKLIEVESAFNKRLITYACVNFERENLKSVLFNLISNIREKLTEAIKKFTSIKFNLFLECEFENIKNETTLHNFKSKNEALFRSSDITKSVISHLNK
ncbi:hypothetical protein C0J52_12461 [Blattella germanica]|nr:hypothetical protein C0J52_12461 [Blattella germanica]